MQTLPIAKALCHGQQEADDDHRDQFEDQSSKGSGSHKGDKSSKADKNRKDESKKKKKDGGQGSLSIDQGFHGHSKDLSLIKSFKKDVIWMDFDGMNGLGLFGDGIECGTPNPEVEEQQCDDVLLLIGDRIVDPIECPNAGPDDVDIEDVAVKDVVLEGIVAAEDPMEDPDKNE
ncbi:hypothetical protein AgCh_005827 [Apium graveolens]